MSYDLPVKRCFNLNDHSGHSWEFRNEAYTCPGIGRLADRARILAGETLQPAGEPTEEERKAAEDEYTVTAFDYQEDPVGSRDWCLFWKGWAARSRRG